MPQRSIFPAPHRRTACSVWLCARSAWLFYTIRLLHFRTSLLPLLLSLFYSICEALGARAPSGNSRESHPSASECVWNMTVDTDLARVPLAFALLTRRAALLARRRRGHGLRASLKSNAKLRKLGTHHRQASELCFKVAEQLRTDGASGAHLRAARCL